MISVIVPVFNEAENLASFLKELNNSLSQMSASYEILAVNDGSTDNSLSVMNKIKKRIKKLKVISLRKNFGKSAAYLVGFMSSKGDYIVTIDADGQDDPQEIGKLLTQLEKGNQVVVGWREKRADSYWKKASSLIWNRLLFFFSRINLNDVNSGLKAFKKEVLRQEYFRGDFHRYLPVIIGMDGYRVTEVPVRHRFRTAGTTKYNLTRTFPALFDFFTNMFLARFAFKPMHLFGSIGFLIFTAGLVINFYLLLVKISGQSIGGRPLLILGLLFTISGLQFIFTGFLADLYINRENVTLEESVKKYL